MDTREISAHLHDILRAAHRIRLPGPGCTAEASIGNVDDVKARVRALIGALSDDAPRPAAARVRPSAAVFPEGRIAGTRTIVQHRRRTRATTASRDVEASRAAAGSGGARVLQMPATRSARDAAEALFALPSVEAGAAP